ncbi:hypothetical protein THASP1DRAFT_29129 [Thamnocephalis sphaerospora]|uniref:Integral membrane protein n=1 Tax=Thamnocephalis sphaerospora TaxID=78915 RepID=A0A4P9XSW6_9FUNG|nr:hypothetical protein THASP1DRAFT_29129 [Thamnocephalis sphaerospora]|eukprot:RKP09072.1 hypothetical protein THASP1DRAFT_29129 [Thamnocephalis sphaerospora]
MTLFRDSTPLTVPRSSQNSVFVILLTLMFWIFFNNGLSGGSLLYARRSSKGARLYLPILNFIPSVIGCILCVYIVLQRSWPGFADCEGILAIDAAAISLGTASIVGILVTRVYYAWMRHNWLLYLGGVLILANFAVSVSIPFAMPMRTDENGTCRGTAKTYWPIIKFSTDIVTNIILSGLYLYVLTRAFRGGFSTSVYAELRHEGFISTFLVIVSSIVSTTIVILDLVPDNSIYVYGVDILINATLVNQMLCRRHKNGSSHTRSANHMRRINSVA